MKLLLESLSKADKDTSIGDKYLINVGTPRKPLVYVAEVIKVAPRVLTFRYNGTEARGKRIEIGRASSKIISKTRRKNTHKPLTDAQASRVLQDIGTPESSTTVNNVNTTKKKTRRQSGSDTSTLSKAEMTRIMTEVLARKLKLVKVRPSTVANMEYTVDGPTIAVKYTHTDGSSVETKLTDRMLRPANVDSAAQWLEAKGASSSSEVVDTSDVNASDEDIMFKWLSKVVKNSFSVIDKSILPTQDEYTRLKYIGSKVKTGREGDEAEATIVGIGRRTNNSKVSILLVTKKGSVLSTVVPSVSELGIAKKLKGLEAKIIGRRASYSIYSKLFNTLLQAVKSLEKDHTDRVENNTKAEKKFKIDTSLIGKVAKVKFSNGIFNKEIKKINPSQQRFAIVSRTGDLRWLDYKQIVGIVKT